MLRLVCSSATSSRKSFLKHLHSFSCSTSFPPHRSYTCTIMAATERLSYSRSLGSLRTRSLRDLQASPPPPPIPETPRRRKLAQVSSFQRRETEKHLLTLTATSAMPPQSIPSPFSPTSNNDHQPNRNAVEMQSIDVQLGDLQRSMFNSDIQISAELRYPPVDPRKSHRHCTDFGLSGYQSLQLSPPSPVPDNSSMASTPLAIYTEAEADSDTSSNLEFSFPRPPTLDGSMRLRRMRSSPFFHSDETNVVKHLLKKRYGGGFVAVRHMSDAAFEPWQRSHEIPKNFSKKKSLMDLKMPSLDQISRRSFIRRDNCELKDKPLPPFPITPEEDTSISPSHFSPPFKHRKGVSWNSLSHMASEPKHRRYNDNRDASPIVTEQSSANVSNSVSIQPALRLPVINPLDRLELSIEKLKTYDPRQQMRNHAAIAPWEYQLQPNPQLSNTNLPSLASAGRQKPTHRSHMSVPLTGLGFTNMNTFTPESQKGLGTPFHHRSTQSQPTLHMLSNQEALPKSFIDITPEQEARHGIRTRKAQLKKLLMRASGLLGWNKNPSLKGGSEI